ncbi:PQQ-binding-like beta-propeller repeat protein [Streptomyces sp. NPDC058773]|uniref:outer membrane protein assembly factor BamB family protein n=1 Tax=Streptomyces sp. NPDC058773 TaxID=3346632 RepID=UPI00369C2DB8
MGQPQGPPQQGYPGPAGPQGGQQPPPPYAQNQGQVPGPAPFPGGPTAGPFPQGPGQSPGPARSGAPVPLILAIAMVVLIGAGVGGYFLLSGDDSADPAADRPANAIPRIWEAPSPVSEREGQDENNLRSLWFNNDDIILGDGEGVRAYNRKTGKKQWKVKTPKGAGELCAMSKEPSEDGVGAVVFDAGGDDCSFLSVVDTDTGRTLWSKNLKGESTEDSPQMVVNSKVVAVAIGDTYAGFTITGGAKVWELTARGHDCTTTVGLSPQYRAVGSVCSDAKPKKQLALQDLEYSGIHSTVSGEDRAVGQILSDRPLTIRMSAEADAIDAEGSLSTYTEEGKPDHTFKLEGELKDLSLEPRDTFVDEDENVLVSGYGSGGMAAMDLKTGKLLWKKSGAAAAALDTDGLIAVATAPATGPAGRDPVLVSLGLRDGKEKVLGTLYDPKHALGSPDLMSLAWDGHTNTLFIQGEGLSHDKSSIQAFKAPTS